jgi:hypothetical protein
MDKRQTLTEFLVKEIMHHLENRECITSFCLNVNMSHTQLKGFLSGGVSIRLKKADSILNYINEFTAYH